MNELNNTLEHCLDDEVEQLKAENAELKAKLKLQHHYFSTQFEEIKNHYERIIAVMPGHVYWKDVNGVCLGCNENFAKTLNLPREEIIGKNGFDFIDKENAQQILEQDLKIIASDQEVVLEEEGYDKQHNKAYYMTRKVPLRNEQGDVIGIIGISLDITSKKNAETLLFEKHATEEKIHALQVLAGIIAHELRTPLAAVAAGINGIELYFPILLEAYHTAIKHKLISKKIRTKKIKTFENIFSRLKHQVIICNNIIDIQLNNVFTNQLNKADFIKLSIKNIIERAIVDYPSIEEEYKVINVSIDHDFLFYGDANLTKHILWNLMKNALYFIKDVRKGKVYIWTACEENYNVLYFKDTAKGMPKDMIDKIFNRFYSQRDTGTGLGLTFCKLVMEAYGGSITCESVADVYTEFKLKFPKT